MLVNSWLENVFCFLKIQFKSGIMEVARSKRGMVYFE